jgi:hypothetical protein
MPGVTKKQERQHLIRKITAIATMRRRMNSVNHSGLDKLKQQN